MESGDSEDTDSGGKVRNEGEGDGGGGKIEKERGWVDGREIEIAGDEDWGGKDERGKEGEKEIGEEREKEDFSRFSAPILKGEKKTEIEKERVIFEERKKGKGKRKDRKEIRKKKLEREEEKEKESQGEKWTMRKLESYQEETLEERVYAHGEGRGLVGKNGRRERRRKHFKLKFEEFLSRTEERERKKEKEKEERKEKGIEGEGVENEGGEVEVKREEGKGPHEVNCCFCLVYWGKGERAKGRKGEKGKRGKGAKGKWGKGIGKSLEKGGGMNRFGS